MAPRTRAIAVLVGLVALFIAGLLVSPPVPPVAPTSGPFKGGDGGLFEAVIDRLRAGEPYYEAMGAELRQRFYPTASPFNWRTPLLYVVLSWVPHSVGFGLLVVLTAVAVVLMILHLSREPAPEVTIVGLVAVAGVVVTMIAPACRLLTETWSGLLIGLSVAAYLRSSWMAGAVLGIAALFVRELAAPYCLVAAVLAARSRRRAEVRVWAAGLMAFGAFYAWHIVQSQAHHRLGDLTHVNSWVQFGGLPFWLLMMKVNAIFLKTPQFVLSLGAVLLVSVFWARSVSPYISWSILVYIAFFLVVGQPFNDYWGYLPSLVWAIGFAYGLAGLSSLVQTATGRAPDHVR